MDNKEKLAELIRRLPGIGPRQAKRIVYFLLASNVQYTQDLAQTLSTLHQGVTSCSLCFRYFEERNTTNKDKKCSICSSRNRTPEHLMIVSRDIDLESIERSGTYNGFYFVLGGTIPLLHKNPEETIRMKNLANLLPFRIEQGLKEIIIALDATPDGDHTGDFIIKNLKEIIKNTNKVVGISNLGRGLSTGTELEYSDKETIKNALSSRFLS